MAKYLFYLWSDSVVIILTVVVFQHSENCINYFRVNMYLTWITNNMSMQSDLADSQIILNSVQKDLSLEINLLSKFLLLRMKYMGGCLFDD